MSGQGESSRSGMDVDRSSANGKRNRLEIIDDPSELLSKPLASWEDAAIEAADKAEQEHLRKARKTSNGTGSAGETSRKLPNAFLNGGSASSTKSSGIKPKAGNGLKIFQPPPRPAPAAPSSSLRRQASDIPTVSGSGARVPTAFLNEKGGFSRQAVAAADPDRKADLSMPAAAAASSSKPLERKRGAIDLTADDDDDEITVVSSKKADPGVEVDEQRSNAPVCIGLVQATVTALHGMPSICRLEPGETTTPHDAFYTKAQWQQASHFWTQPGWRPVLLSIDRRLPNEPKTSVSTVLAPGLVHQRAVERAINANQPLPIREDASARIQQPFGELAGADRCGRILTNLLATSAVRCEARVPVVGPTRAALFLHEIQILVFTTRSNMATVSNIFTNHGIVLKEPSVYHPEDYPESPQYINCQQAFLPAAHAGMSSTWDGNQYGSVMQTKEMTEQERKRQVDTVYDSLRGGEDLAQVEPDKRISTPLFPHQKQALAFLLDREKERKFAEVKLADDEAVDAKGKGKSTDDEDEIISLWQAKRNSQGKVRSYYNVVTQSSTSKKPYLTRGAILADDMGLGKTISTIALIASTMDEAAAFAKNKIRKAKASPVLSPGDSTPSAPAAGQSDVVNVDDESDDEIRVIAGAPPLSKAAAAKGKAKPKKQKEDPETTRRKNLVVRSRATLIVLPLTLLSGWEDQLREHWGSECQPSCYVYHGPSRVTDPVQVADHDIVITTYSTLGTEFSTQRSWADEDESDEGEGSGSGNANGKKKKKKARSTRGESANTLQKIDWFRVVLDEAHSIKEPSTHQSKAVCNLTAQRRLALTGTPVQNRIDDLYALIKFLRLEPFTDRSVWNTECGGGGDKRGQLASRKDKADILDNVAMAKVQTIMKFLTLRRTKETKQKDGTKLLSLPPKSSRIMSLEFDKHEAARYGMMHSRYKEDFELMKASDTLRSNYATILHEISNLRMTCDHSALVDESKDLKRHKEGQSLELAIEEHGITKARAIELFSILAQADRARCAVCDVDLTSSPEDGNGGTDAKPVLTQCKHLVCSDCFAVAMAGKWPDSTSEDRGPCPACDVVLGPLVEAVQLEPQDIDAGEGGGEALEGMDDDDPGVVKRGPFGADGMLPIDARADLSTKIRALLSDLIPFSRCNPHSILYDATAPVLDQVPAEELKLEADSKAVQESVVVKQVPPGTAEAKKIKPIKSVVFSQWTKMLDHVHQSLYRAGIKDARLDGRMNRQQRAEHLERFKSDPSVEVLLVSLKAGGVGLNLVSACRAYLLEPYWNPATENQGLDRIHRLGQVRPVITTKYVIKNSIETAMLEIQRRKMLLAQRVGERRGATTQQMREQELSLIFSATGAPTPAEDKQAEGGQQRGEAEAAV